MKLESYFYSSFVVYSPGNGVNGIAIELRLWEEKCSTGMSFVSVKGEKQCQTKWWMSSDRGVSNWGRLCLYQMSLILYFIFKHHFPSKLYENKNLIISMLSVHVYVVGNILNTPISVCKLLNTPISVKSHTRFISTVVYLFTNSSQLIWFQLNP